MKQYSKSFSFTSTDGSYNAMRHTVRQDGLVTHLLVTNNFRVTIDKARCHPTQGNADLAYNSMAATIDDIAGSH